MAEKGVLCGEYFLNGDTACAEGAISAGCRFFAGYPITPATEVAERMADRLPQVGGTYIQMEDELASMNAILGASWAGVKSHDLDLRSGLQPDDGEPGTGSDAGNTLRAGEYPACRAFHRLADHGSPGGYDASPLGFPRQL